MWLGEDSRGWDHARIHRQLVTDRRLGAYEVAVYTCLAIHAETMTGDCRPAEATIAGYLGCSDRQVRRAIGTLRAAAYLGVKHAKGKASTYTLLPPPTPDCESGHPGLWVRSTPD